MQRLVYFCCQKRNVLFFIKIFSMKKYLFFISAVFISSIANAQLSRKTWLIGGAGSFYSYNEEYSAPGVDVTGDYTGIDISASAGYFFMDKLSGGLRPYFSSFKGESSGGGISNDLKIAIGPFVRYYFLKADKQFNLLTDISYLVGTNQSNAGARPKGKFNTFMATAGVELFFNSAVGLEILIGYRNQIASFEDSPSAYRSDRKGVYISIGFQFHLKND